MTHQAIDQLLLKVVTIVNRCKLENFPIHCLKWGRWNDKESGAPNSAPEPKNQIRVEAFANRSAAAKAMEAPYLILGATGYGLNSLLSKPSRNKSADDRFFDWIIFDEASQILLPQALLSLEHGRGNFLFLGDIHQLLPIIQTPVFADENNDLPQNHLQLDTTYRMNDLICQFPSRMWYDGKLKPAPRKCCRPGAAYQLAGYR